MDERQFWLTMTYGCECGFETPIHAEFGVEGPRRPTVQWVPSPFIAGDCPSCNKRWGLTHVRLNEDVEHDPPLTDVEGPRFLRPSRAARRDPQACGVLIGLDALGV